MNLLEFSRSVASLGFVLWLLLTTSTQVLKEATLLFLHNTASLAEVIPGFDYLDKFFATVMADAKVSSAVWAVVGLGKRDLNKYYGLTDAFLACKIVLHELLEPSCCARTPASCFARPLAPFSIVVLSRVLLIHYCVMRLSVLSPNVAAC